jgi:hypothetical protein
MKTQTRLFWKIAPGALLLAVVLFSLAFSGGSARPALAGSCVTGDMLPAIDSVQPAMISNAVSSTLTIIGSNFEEGAIVILDGYGALSTTCVNPTVLTAVVPPGVPGEINGRSYTVQVVNATNPDTNTDEAAAALLVLVPAPPSDSPGAEATPTAFVRPLITVQGYAANPAELEPGREVSVDVALQNSGQTTASNLVITFGAGDLIPLVTGGVQSISSLGAGGVAHVVQRFVASSSLSGHLTSLPVQVSYTDQYGASYSETFTLTLAVKPRTYTPLPTATPTPVPVIVRPQLVIASYTTDLEYLQPGARFTLTLNVQNVGTADAQDVTMIAGGGTVSDGGSGTPGPGGVSGGSGDFTNFAPVGASNVQVLGDIAAGSSIEAAQPLVVNLSTNAGAYPFKVTFTYTTRENQRFTDDQSITLLVYVLPQIEVSFYRDPNPIYAGTESSLPLQVVNTGRAGAVMGTLSVTSEGGDVFNNTLLVGYLDRGSFITLDALLIPYQAGPLTLIITIPYTDDFGQQQMITGALDIEVQEALPIEPFPDGGGYEPLPVEPETFWQKVWRFIRGLLGLDSARILPETPVYETPVEGVIDGGYNGGGGVVVPVPVPKGP